jgi:ribosomal protein S18 acetylase RimI-like enzyme
MRTAAVTVRAADTRDRAFVADLGRRTASSSVSSLRVGDPRDVAVAFERLVAFVYERKHVALVAELDGRRVGFLLMVFDVPDEVTLTDQAFIAYTAVEPHARRSGAGRALLAEAERLARAAGRDYVSLMVTEDNDPARSLYRGAGYATERRMMTKRL